MAIRSAGDGSFAASSGGSWLPGMYKTEKAARLAFRVDPSVLSAAWEAKRGRSGIIDASDDFTEDEVRALLRKATDTPAS